MSETNKVGMVKQGSLGRYATWDTTECAYTLDDARKEIERESNVRMKCYDRWVAEGKMTQTEADTRMGSLVAAWHFLADTEQGQEMLLDNKRKELPF